MEIGSEFSLEKVNIKNRKVETIFHWANYYKYSYYSLSGRNSIMFLLDNINIEYKKVLMPSYICDSVINAFIKYGFEIMFYNLDEKLNPIILENYGDKEIGIFLHMGYYGFFTNETLESFIDKLKSKKTLIIEDVTHTLFSKHKKNIKNDFVFASIRKWMGVPSGGILFSNEKFFVDNLKIPEKFIEIRKEGLKIKREYLETNEFELKNQYLDKIRNAEKILNKDYDIYAIDDLSKKIICNYNFNCMCSIRRENYIYLFEQLSKIENVKVVFEQTFDTETPLFFPIYVNKKRNILRKKLIEKSIYCPIHWPISNCLFEYINNSTQKIYDSILSIPCDQRYNTDDMQRIIDAIKDVMQ